MAGSESEEVAVSGDIFIQSRDDEGDDANGTLDEPISTTLVSYACCQG